MKTLDQRWNVVAIGVSKFSRNSDVRFTLKSGNITTLKTGRMANVEM